MSEGAAQAIVEILPDFSRFGNALAGGVENPLRQLSGTISSTLGGLGPGGAVVGGVVAGAGAVGAALFGIGEKFQSARNQITLATGATGTDLDKLNDDFKKVFASSASSMGDAAKAIGFLAERTGLAGAPLDDLAKRQLDLARITKTDLGANMDATTGVFAKFGIAAKDQGPALDVLFKAAQNGGKTVTEIAGQLKSGGTTFTQFGFDIDHAAAFVSALDKAGVNTGQTMAALKKAFATFSQDAAGPNAKDISKLTDAVKGTDKAVDSAKDSLTRLTTSFDVQQQKAEESGKTWTMNASQTLALQDAQKKLKDAVDAQTEAHTGLAQAQSQVGKSTESAHDRLMDMFNSIKNAKTDTDAMSLAVHTFGARAGGELVGAIRSGRLSLDDLAKTLGDGKGGIEDTAKSTETLSVKFTRLKNEVLVALEPVARRVLDGVETGIEKVGEAFNKAKPDIEIALGVLKEGFEKAEHAIKPIFEYFSDHRDQLIGGLAALGVVVATLVVPPLITAAASAIATAAPFIAVGAAAFAVGAGAVYLYTHFKIVREVVSAVKLEFQYMWHLLQDDVWPALQAVGRFIRDDIVPALETFWHGVVDVANHIADFVSAVPGAIGSVISFFHDLPGNVLDAIKQIPDLLKQAGMDALRGFGYGLGFVIGETLKFFIDLPANLLKAVETVGKAGGWLLQHGTDALRGLLDGILSVVPDLFNFFVGLPAKFMSFFVNANLWLLDTGWHLLHGLIDGAIQGGEDLFKFFKDLPGNIMRIVGDLGHLLYDAGTDVLKGLLRGIVDAAKTLAGPLSALAGGIVDGARSALGAKSPATRLIPVGHDVVDGMALGIRQRAGMARLSLQGVADQLVGVTAGSGGGSAAVALRDRPGSHDAPRAGVTQIFHLAPMSPGEVARQAADEVGWVLKGAAY